MISRVLKTANRSYVPIVQSMRIMSTYTPQEKEDKITKLIEERNTNYRNILLTSLSTLLITPYSGLFIISSNEILFSIYDSFGILEKSLVGVPMGLLGLGGLGFSAYAGFATLKLSKNIINQTMELNKINKEIRANYDYEEKQDDYEEKQRLTKRRLTNFDYDERY